MKFRSQVYTQVSGSIGGITYSHNQGGLYTRARSVPTNPQSPYQEVIRSAIRALTNRWGTVLTTGQRLVWDNYASEVKLPDVFGELRNVSGLSHYIRSNSPRIQADLSIIDAAPEIGALPGLSLPTVSGDVSDQEVSIVFSNGDQWAKETGGVLFCWASRPMPDSINFFRGPYRFAGTILGNTATPPTSPQELTAPFALVAGQTVHCVFRAGLADGALSGPFRSRGGIAA